ncbi:amidohydrolase [Frigoribacterium sp. VKM Ac-2836]|uniref:amidohydrolase n=1 Tax=Frigoribacterium sp. VKM Ac-2836 TaxID=2739014 RepID=UPI0015648E31|nr:amidohydrolase [Frigoribacterium sp. VKM Ac-2836]NRD27714.1 amidohydrolase [Frigoribacterium sp. VKM Ac-2836]
MTTEQRPPSVDLVIRRVTVLAGTRRPVAAYPDLPVDDPGRPEPVDFLHDHAIGVVGADIAWIKPDGEVSTADLETARVIDAPGRIAMPGMINTHSHSSMTYFRGSAEDVPTASWFNDHIWPMEVNLTERDVSLGARLAVAEMLLAGVTTVADHYFSMEQIAAAIDEGGMRAVLAETFFSSQGAAGLDRSAAFAAEWNGRADGRITTMLGPHAVYTVDDADLVRTADTARSIGVRSHVHASETMHQTESSLARRGVTPIQVLHDTGMLDAGALIAHGTGIVESDLAWLTPYSDRVGVACCAKVYQKHTHTTTPIRLLHDAGITVGIGTDGCASHNTLDMFESVRTMALVQKSDARDATWMPSSHSLDLLTRQSAAAIGREHDLGALRPGFKADIVLIDPRKPHLQPMNDLAAALVLSVRSSDVETVIVDGRVVVDGGRLVGVDLDPLMVEMNERLPGLTDRSHGTTIQTYAP